MSQDVEAGNGGQEAYQVERYRLRRSTKLDKWWHSINSTHLVDVISASIIMESPSVLRRGCFSLSVAIGRLYSWTAKCIVSVM